MFAQDLVDEIDVAHPDGVEELAALLAMHLHLPHGFDERLVPESEFCRDGRGVDSAFLRRIVLRLRLGLGLFPICQRLPQPLCGLDCLHAARRHQIVAHPLRCADSRSGIGRRGLRRSVVRMARRDASRGTHRFPGRGGSGSHGGRHFPRQVPRSRMWRKAPEGSGRARRATSRFRRISGGHVRAMTGAIAQVRDVGRRTVRESEQRFDGR